MTPSSIRSSRFDPVWTVRGRELDLSRTRTMGIVNVTPDSFYDGGRHDATGDAVAHGRRLLEEGADVVDVGGESTRPGAEPVPVDEELERVEPVVAELVDEVEDRDAVLSVDTRKAEVARACLERGAHVINDVSALADPDMPGVVADHDAGVVLMHMQGTPETMQDEPSYDDVVRDVRAYLEHRIAAARKAGIDAGAICVDPGIGFGKTVEHNLTLIRGLADIVDLGYPVLVGPSRKSLLAGIGGPDDPDDRLLESLGAAVCCALFGAHVVRVHDVAETRRVLAVADAVDGADDGGG